MAKVAFDTDHLKKTYFSMTLPVVMGMVISLIYNLADTYYIAQTGVTELVAGVSLCAPLFTFLMAFGNIFGQGGSSLMSRLLGQGNKDAMHRVSSFCFYAALVIGIVTGAIMLLFKTPVLHLIGATDETIAYASDYFTVFAAGAPLVVLAFIHSNLLRCEGKALQSMIGNAFGSIVNIILDPILILSLGMGARGAAIATIIGYASSDLFFLIIVLKKSEIISVNIRKAHVVLDEAKQIIGIGITAALSNIMSSLATIVFNHFLVPYGSERVAAMGIVMKTTMISQLIMTGFAFGAVPIFGYLCGANRKDKLNELIRFCLLFLGTLALSFSLILFIFAPQIIRAFMDQADIITYGVPMLRYQVIGSIFAGYTLLFTVLFQASGKVLPAFCMSISRQGVVFMAVLFILVTVFGYNGLLVAQASADFISCILGLTLYRKVMAKAEK